MLSEGRVFKERSEKKKGAARREGMVSQVADMKVYLEGSEKHHETGGGCCIRKKNTVNLFMHTVPTSRVPDAAVSYCIIFHKALLLCKQMCGYFVVEKNQGLNLK